MHTTGAKNEIIDKMDKMIQYFHTLASFIDFIVSRSIEKIAINPCQVSSNRTIRIHLTHFGCGVG